MKTIERVSKRTIGGAFLLLLVWTLANCGGGSSSESGAVVAKVGDRTIGMRQITDQIDAWQMSYPTDQAALEARLDVLNRLIRDQMLIIGAYSRALDADIGIVELVDREKDKFLLDELFRKEVIEKATVTEEDIQNAYERWFDRVRPMHILVDTKEEADSIKAALDAGGSFADLAVEHSIDRGTVVRGGDFGREFEWGELMEPLQSVVFPMKEGEYSEPIKSDFGWHIVGVKSRRTITQKPLDQVRGVIEERLKRRAQEQRRMEQVKEIEARLTIHFDPDILTELQRYVSAGRDTLPPGQGLQPTLPATAIAPELKAETFVHFGNDNTLTTEEFVEQYNQRPPPGRPDLMDSSQVKQFVFQVGMFDILREEALRLKLDQTPIYRDRLKEFQEKLMAEKMRNNLIARNLVVTEDDVRAFYDSHIDSLAEPEQYHVREILVHDEAFAQELLKKAKAGADFEALAREHTKRPGFQNNAGDIGWVGPRRYGELYETASQLEVGEVGGVVPGVGQYSVIKLLDRQPSRIREYDEVKNSIFSELQKRRSNQIIESFIDSMKTVYPVVIHEEVLTSGLPSASLADTAADAKS